MQYPINKPRQNSESEHLQTSDDDADKIGLNLDVLPGQIVGNHYEVQSLIGTGGLGAVYKAHHKLLNKTVAIKFLRPGKRLDSNAVVRFQREAAAVIGLSHENIASVQEFGLYNEIPFLVMEMIDGQSLADIIKQEGALSSARSVAIFKQLLQALDYSHNQGIIHRDVKPENILVCKNDSGAEQIKLIDFGLAKVVENDESVDITKTGDVLGTPSYMSPEQCRGMAIDQRTDLYSAGCVVHEMIFGQPPFTGETSIEVILKHVTEMPKLQLAPPDAIGLERVVHRSLAKDRQNRYASANEMLSEIALIEDGKAPQNTFFVSRQLIHRSFVYSVMAILLALCISVLVFAIVGQEKTVRSLSKNIRESPNQIVNYIDRAKLYAARGDYDAAWNDLCAAKKIDPRSSKCEELERMLNQYRPASPSPARSTDTR